MHELLSKLAVSTLSGEDSADLAWLVHRLNGLDLDESLAAWRRLLNDHTADKIHFAFLVQAGRERAEERGTP